MNKLGNVSSAVVQQRNSPRNQGLDDFPTPPWATRALIEHVLTPESQKPNEWFREDLVWEPACNRGFMACALRNYFGTVRCSDIVNYGYKHHDFTTDFLMPGSDDWGIANWIITNPPFRLAEQFALRCIDLDPSEGFALLVRTSFLEGVGRYQNLFSKRPPSVIAQFSERVPMVEGRYDPFASTATSYCWLVWDRGEKGTEFTWIPPCRDRLKRPGDISGLGAEDA